MAAAWVFGISFLVAVVSLPILRWIDLRLHRVAIPRDDRWHIQPIPKGGGIAIFVAFLAAILMVIYFEKSSTPKIIWPVFLTAGLMFTLGLYDDTKELTPPVKLIGQIIAASLIIAYGYRTDFFTPRIGNAILAQSANVILTFIWLIGITNAYNLLDNMDGLAGGIGLISTSVLGYFFWLSGDSGLLTIAAAIAGCLLAFMLFNFPPARIFMGNSGSIFIGFTLAFLGIARQPQASNVIAVMGVPILLFVLPIIDTMFVTITRLLRGQNPAQGGRDHTSHRLVAFGLSERQTLLVLYGVAIISGLLAVLVEKIDYWLSLALVPLLMTGLAITAGYLARIKFIDNATRSHPRGITQFITDLIYRVRLFEIFLDIVLIGLSYYIAFWISFELTIPGQSLDILLGTLPIVYAGTFICFITIGIYRGVWRYISVNDLMRFFVASVSSALLVWLLVNLFFKMTGQFTAIAVIYMIILLLCLLTSRISFKVLDQFLTKTHGEKGERVLIIGAGDAGEMAARWIMMNPQLGYQPVGFLDDNNYLYGKQIHGITIIGNLPQITKMAAKYNITGVIIAVGDSTQAEISQEFIDNCRTNAIWIRYFRLEFI